MTVKELIEELSEMDPEAAVFFIYNFGDYWKTMVAAPVNKINEGEVVESKYHNMFKLKTDDDENNGIVIVALQ